MYKKVSKAIDSKEYTTDMFLDLSKAFNSVNPYTNVSTLV